MNEYTNWELIEKGFFLGIGMFIILPLSILIIGVIIWLLLMLGIKAF